MTRRDRLIRKAKNQNEQPSALVLARLSNTMLANSYTRSLGTYANLAIASVHEDVVAEMNYLKNL